MALRAGHRGAHPHLHGGVHAIDHRHIAKLLVSRASLVVRLRVTMKSGGDELIVAGLVEQIARELFACELIERHVAVQRTDHPVAIAPNRARLVIGITGAVRVAREVQPLLRPVLAIRRLGQQTIDQFPVSLWRFIRYKRLHLIRRRRQSREVQTHAADERMLVRLQRGLPPASFQLRENEAVHIVAPPLRILHRRQRLALRFHICPMRLVLSPLRNPLLEDRLLLSRQRQLRFLGRHHLIGVLRKNAVHQLAVLGVARLDCKCSPFPLRNRPRPHIQPQLPLPCLRIRPVAGETILRKNRPHIAIKRNLLRRRLHDCRQQPQTQNDSPTLHAKNQ